MGLEKINVIRKEKGLSVDDLVELSGIPKGTLSKITAGITKNPSLETVSAIAKALGCTLDDLRDSQVDKCVLDTSWSRPIIDAYQQSDLSTQQAACAVLRIPHVKAPSVFDGIETLAAHSDGLTAEETEQEAAIAIQRLRERRAKKR